MPLERTSRGEAGLRPCEFAGAGPAVELRNADPASACADRLISRFLKLRVARCTESVPKRSRGEGKEARSAFPTGA
jgi:hypothetical protein